MSTQTLNESKPFLTLMEVAQSLAVHYQTAFKLATKGAFPNAVKIDGRAWRIPPADVTSYLEKSKQHQPPAAAA
jgi:excisionase family DNA binding protein